MVGIGFDIVVRMLRGVVIIVAVVVVVRHAVERDTVVTESAGDCEVCRCR